ncbi:hypothetical protein ES703_26864 [subsurface metagenome]
MAEKSGFDFYLEEVRSMIKEAQERERENIFKAAEMIAESLANGGVLHAFGSSHSLILVKEIFYRAGGLAPINLISASGMRVEDGIASTWLERQEGYATRVLDKYQTTPGEVMLIVSTSGRNAVPIEMALEAKKRGLKLIALTSLTYSKSVESRHSSGKKLFEVADIVIDNGAIPGDAIVKVEGVPHKVGPASCVVGCAILQALVVRVVEIMAEKGLEPPVWLAANVPGGDEANTKYFNRYRARIRHL